MKLNALLEAANEYEGSEDFTSDLDKVDAAFQTIRKIVTQKKWENWCKVTDENYSTDCMSKQRALMQHFKQALAAYDGLNEEMMSAE